MSQLNIGNVIDNRVSKACKEAGHKRVYVNYSAYTTDTNYDPIDNLDEVAITGKVILVGFTDEYWGGSKSKDYESPVLTNPTWLQVAVYANEMIKTTNDHHHVFLECLDKVGEDSSPDGKIIKYEFGMGS